MNQVPSKCSSQKYLYIYTQLFFIYLFIILFYFSSAKNSIASFGFYLDIKITILCAKRLTVEETHRRSWGVSAVRRRPPSAPRSPPAPALGAGCCRRGRFGGRSPRDSGWSPRWLRTGNGAVGVCGRGSSRFPAGPSPLAARDLRRTERSRQTGAGLGGGGSPPPHTAARMLRSLKGRLSHGQFQFWGAGWG